MVPVKILVCIHNGAHALNYSCNLSDANSLFSLEHCLARQSTWSSASCQALPCCSTNAKAMKSCV